MRAILCAVLLGAIAMCVTADVTDVPKRLYAHDAVLDSHGVIAPWYGGQNGQLDLRARVAAETLKRYPWAIPGGGVRPAPHYVFSGAWRISASGEITIPGISPWENGDLGQRAAYLLLSLVDYYRYSGDATVIGPLSLTADHLIDWCTTPADHPWPEFLVSVPVKGTAYGRADPHGFIQLDIVAEAGLGLLRAYQMMGNRRWLQAVEHWADVPADHADLRPGRPTWGRYANPEDVPWADPQTGGVAFILALFDELLRMGYEGQDGAVLKARDAGRRFLKETFLPRWAERDTWGRNYWDWMDDDQAENVTEFVVRYMMENPDAFPSWRTDCRNIMSLFINRTSVSPASNGDVFAGAWAYPESTGCCGRSLWYGPMELATVYAQYGELADDEWAREMARRQILLATYDVHETGVVEDNIDGGQIVAGAWFKIAHPMALRHALGCLAWQPETLGAGRENHIVRSTSVVQRVTYAKGEVAYTTFDAVAPCVDVLRLSFTPTEVRADGKRLSGDVGPDEVGYRVEPLADGDFVVTIRHDGGRHVTVRGEDPQQEVDEDELSYTGPWQVQKQGAARGGTRTEASTSGAAAACAFSGSQVRIIGAVGPEGGLADVYLDGEKQLCGIDAWCPIPRQQQVLWARSGLRPGPHEMRVVVRGRRNPVSAGTAVWLDGVQWSAAEGRPQTGEGGGPAGAQRWIMGYTERDDYVDTAGNTWRPGTEFVLRSSHGADVVADNWWTSRRQTLIEGTPDPELYRYGVHGKDFTLHFTVAPGSYHVRLKLCETRRVEPRQRAMSIAINGREVVADLDVAATAGGMCRAADLVFQDIEPRNGVVSVRLWSEVGEAILQAAEVGPGDGGAGVPPVLLAGPVLRGGNLLVNGGFEACSGGVLGRLGERTSLAGWQVLFSGARQAYVWSESDYSIHPDWGLPEIHEGKQALRTHADAEGRTVIFQEVATAPGRTYRASVWVRACDLRGKGFGVHPGDMAALRLQEIGPCGKVLIEHPPVAVTAAGPYRRIEKVFTTGDKTAQVRFLLDTVIAAPYNEGHVTYDECVLEAERKGNDSTQRRRDTESTENG